MQKHGWVLVYACTAKLVRQQINIAEIAGNRIGKAIGEAV